MRDKGRILVGLAVFLALVTFPVWYNLFAGQPPAPPEPKLPIGGGQCVQDTATMRTDHMALLMEWRDDAVRSNDRIFTTSDGRRYYKSLSATCMSCHAEKSEFCDKCHNYAAVSPYCWDCHVEPTGGQ
jgi:hypothetical protein